MEFFLFITKIFANLDDEVLQKHKLYKKDFTNFTIFFIDSQTTYEVVY